MGNRKTTLTEIFSYTTIGVSLALMSGLALGHVTEQSIHPRLSAPPLSDPVERYALGQNAYETTNAHIKMAHGQPAAYTGASYEIGRYEKGARILTPEEPARKVERLRLEQLQAWQDQNFGPDSGLDDERPGHAETHMGDYGPIDVGAVIDAPESAATYAVQHIGTDDSGV